MLRKNPKRRKDEKTKKIRQHSLIDDTHGYGKRIQETDTENENGSENGNGGTSSVKDRNSSVQSVRAVPKPRLSGMDAISRNSLRVHEYHFDYFKPS